MKKLWLILATSVFLAACSADETTKDTATKEQVQKSAEQKTEQTTKQQAEIITEEQAKLIAGHVFLDFKDVWINAEDLYLSLEEEAFMPNTHGDRVMELYKQFATENLLTEEFIHNFKDSCYACDMVPIPTDMSSAQTIELVDATATSFSLKGYFPLNAFTPEANIKQSYILQDGIWKIDEETVEVLQQADGMTYREYEPVETSDEFEALYNRGVAAINEYNELNYSVEQMDLTEIEISDAKFAAKEKLAAIVDEFEEKIMPYDAYYETNKQFWTKLYDETVKSVELFNAGGSRQGTYMIEAECELLSYRIHTLYELYAPYL